MAGSREAVGALAPEDARKLTGILGLLSSDRPGEVASAAAAAVRLLAARGTTWSEVICPEAVASSPAARPATWQSIARECLARPNLTAWEREFAETLLSDFVHPSAKQEAVLTKIGRRLGIVA